MKISLFLVFISLFVCSHSVSADSKRDARMQIDILNQKVQAAGEKGDLQAAIDAAEKAFEISKKELGEKSLETADTMNNVANLYMYADHAADAERLYKKAILIEAEKYGKESKEIADSYYNLAMAYAIQKKYEEGRRMLTLSHKIRLKELGTDHPDTKKTREALDQIWNETSISLDE